MSASVFYSHEFKRNVRKLIKKYPHLPEDLDEFVHRLQTTGHLEGDLLQNVGFEVYKARIKNSDNKKGKSGGYRVIYYFKQNEQIFLITIYVKSEQEDVSIQKIRSIIESWEDHKSSPGYPGL
jgi:mRNA-degrading endonuclease RelE of RelBE toxin-antitoxin system